MPEDLSQDFDSGRVDRCKSRLTQLDARFNTLAKPLSLAGNEVRLKILLLIFEERNLAVTEISDSLNMNISAISQHLRKLRDGNIVKVKKVGQTSFYFMNEPYRKLFKPFSTLFEDAPTLAEL